MKIMRKSRVLIARLTLAAFLSSLPRAAPAAPGDAAAYGAIPTVPAVTDLVLPPLEPADAWSAANIWPIQVAWTRAAMPSSFQTAQPALLAPAQPALSQHGFARMARNSLKALERLTVRYWMKRQASSKQLVSVREAAAQQALFDGSQKLEHDGALVLAPAISPTSFLRALRGEFHSQHFTPAEAGRRFPQLSEPEIQEALATLTRDGKLEKSSG